jgi:hypothetical protein
MTADEFHGLPLGGRVPFSLVPMKPTSQSI